MAHILGVGIATLDIINLVDGYPAEDSEVRAIGQAMVRGGNVTNTLVVLSQLGDSCRWLGVLAKDGASDVIRRELSDYKVDFQSCRVVAEGVTPTSYIALNRQNGSRSIVHYRDLPELGYEDFTACDLSGIDWIHFEGRAVDETVKMLAHASRVQPEVPRSVEIEKPREGIEQLFAGADLLIFSRVYAEACGFSDPTQFLLAMSEKAAARELVCTWGIKGAYARTSDGGEYHCPAFVQPEVVDSIGAGDTFNAGYIHARAAGDDVEASLQAACRLAGLKCGQQGFAGLGQRLKEIADQETADE